MNFSRLRRALVVEPITLRLVLGATAFLLSLGFFFGKATNENYKLIEGLMGFYLWGSVMLSYSALKLGQLVYDFKCWMRAITSLIGMWLWMYIFMSFTIFDSTPIAPTEILLIIPVLAEVWSLAGTIYTYNKEHLR